MDDNHIIQSVKDVYDNIATDFSNSRVKHWSDLDFLTTSVKPHESILDLGCGDGRLLTYLPSDVLYTGVDISQNLINIAKQKYPTHKFLNADFCQDLVWQELQQYDHVVAIASLNHIPSQSLQIKFLKHLKTICHDQTQIFITVWNLWQPKYLKYHLGWYKFINIHHTYVPFQGSSRFYFAHTQTQLSFILRQAGFSHFKITKTKQNYLIHIP